MKLVATTSREQNTAVFDAWSVIHGAAGLMFGLLGVRFVPSMGVAVAYDVAENLVERTNRGQRFFRTYGPEHPANIATDLGLFALGWAAGNRYIQDRQP